MWKKKVLSAILIGSLSICPVSLAFAVEETEKDSPETKNSGQSEITLVVEDTNTIHESHEETSKAYSIRVVEQPNGTVQLSSETAKQGEKVVASITAHAGYMISNVVITSEQRKEVITSKIAEGKYEFAMPDANVTVIATFVKEKTEDASNTNKEENIPTKDEQNSQPADTSQKPTTDATLNTDTEKTDPGQTTSSNPAEESNSGDKPTNPSVNDTDSDTSSEHLNGNEEGRPINPSEPSQPNEPSQPSQPNAPKPSSSIPSRPSSNKDDTSSSGKPAKTDHSTETGEKPAKPGSNDDTKPDDSASNPAETNNDNPTATPAKKPQITIIQDGGGNTRVPPHTSGSEDTGGIKATDVPEIPKANVPGVRVMSVFAPITLPVTVAKDGTVVVSNKAAIQSNVTKGDIKVEEVNVKLADGWKAVADDKELKKNQMRLSLREDKWDRFGKLKLTDKNWTVKPIEKLPLNMKVELPEDCVLTETELVKIEFVFDWSET